MARIVIFSVFIFVTTANFVKVSEAGPIAYSKNRDTTLDDLKSIDNYVSGGLPILQDGFFVGTASGPVLVKSEPLPGVNKRPVVRSKYYNTLPRLIPAGFEGIATSNFNLGAASPIQPFSLSKRLLRYPVAAESQARQFFATPTVQPTPQYVVNQPAVGQSQHIYFQAQGPPPTQQQYVHEAPQQYVHEAPQQYVTEPQQPQQYVTEPQQPQQYVAEAQQSQLVSQPYHYHHRAQEFTNPEESQLEAHQQQYQHQFEHHPQQYLIERQVSPSQQPQFNPSQQPQFHPEQDIQENFQNQAPQESSQIEARSHFGNEVRFPSPDAEQSFQIDNLLSEDPPRTEQFQTQLFGRERYHSQRLLPNAAVVDASEFEETLPETLKNRFYKSANLATILAQESLPVQGEQIVGEWDTNKITKSKIHALLSGAGFI